MNPQPKRKNIIVKGKAWEALKQKVYERDGFRCQVCGNTNRDQFEVHHIILKKMGGGNRFDHIDNLLTVCIVCHIPWIHGSRNGWSVKIVQQKHMGRVRQFL